MNLANNYFLLYHGTQIEKETTFNTSQYKNKADFFDIAALILSPTRKNAQNYIGLNSFKELTKQISDRVPHNLNDLLQLQYCLIEAITLDTQKEDLEKLNKAFIYLKEEGVLEEANYNKLFSLFEPSEVTYSKDDKESTQIKNQTTKERKSFHEHKEQLESLIAELKTLFNSAEFKEELDATQTYLNTQKFSIGITGVMNAGKSTMLNALMGKEILGSAVVPETANLTIVKYDENPSANVFFGTSMSGRTFTEVPQKLNP